MIMLTTYQEELIQREIDGENSAEASAEVQQLVATEPEAMALMTSLRSLNAMFNEVPEREPHPRVRAEINNVVSRALPTQRYTQATTQTIGSWAIKPWNSFKNLIEESMTKKVLIGATTAVAIIAIIGYAVVDYKPSVTDAGTIGATEGMGGVQQAGRYKGKALTSEDITLSNPEVMALLQNDKILKLVKSAVFREAMNNDAFRDLTSSESFHELMGNQQFQNLMGNDQFQNLMGNQQFQNLMGNQQFQNLMGNQQFQNLMSGNASRDVSSTEAYRELMSNGAFHDMMSNQVFQNLMGNEAFRETMQNDAFLMLMGNEAFRDIMNNDAFRDIMNNDAFRDIMNNDAFRDLASNEMFRDISHDASLVDVFLNEASHAEQ
jgi:hypothetical protein